MVCAIQIDVLTFFFASTLLDGYQEGHPACTSSGTTISRSLLLGTGLTWSNSAKWAG